MTNKQLAAMVVTLVATISVVSIAAEEALLDDGSVAKLEDAVRIMAKVQLGRELSNDDVGDLIAFLDSLKGALPRNFVEAPELPPIRFAANSAFPNPVPDGSKAARCASYAGRGSHLRIR